MRKTFVIQGPNKTETPACRKGVSGPDSCGEKNTCPLPDIRFWAFHLDDPGREVRRADRCHPGFPSLRHQAEPVISRPGNLEASHRRLPDDLAVEVDLHSLGFALHVHFEGERLEPEPQGPAHVDLVTASLENAPVAYVEAKGVLYYLGETDGKLYALDIISQMGPRRPSFLETPEHGKGER